MGAVSEHELLRGGTIVRIRLALTLLLLSLFITGCNVTKEEAIEKAKVTFETGNSVQAKEPNQETDLFRYYLPASLKIENITENNLILSKSDQLFLIFSNPAEDASSTVNFEQDKLVVEDPLLLETFENEGVFSYIIITPLEEDDYKVIVGIGGEKGSTITDIANIEKSIEIIIEVIKSISY